jgi:hypothetical protein
VAAVIHQSQRNFPIRPEEAFADLEIYQPRIDRELRAQSGVEFLDPGMERIGRQRPGEDAHEQNHRFRRLLVDVPANREDAVNNLVRRVGVAGAVAGQVIGADVQHDQFGLLTGELAMLDDDVTPGSDSGIIESGRIKFGSLICFDSIYEQLTRESLIDGREVLVISTNDSWFYDSAAGRMHNAQAKLRAVESGRYVLRAANTGISSVITPAGKVIEQLEPLTAGYIVADVGARDGKTLYTLTGNFFVALCAFFCIVTAASGLPLGIKKRKIKR